MCWGWLLCVTYALVVILSLNYVMVVTIMCYLCIGGDNFIVYWLLLFLFFFSATIIRWVCQCSVAKDLQILFLLLPHTLMSNVQRKKYVQDLCEEFRLVCTLLIPLVNIWFNIYLLVFRPTFIIIFFIFIQLVFAILDMPQDMDCLVR